MGGIPQNNKEIRLDMGFSIDSKIASGKGELKNLNNYIHSFGYKNIGILCDKNLYESSDYIKESLDFIKELFSVTFFIYDHPFEPSYQYLDSLNKEVKSRPASKDLDCWIGIGGGSSMDAAKVLAILATNPGKTIEYKGFPENLNTPLPVICVPSTTGTGSEVVYNASLIDEETKIKMGVNYIKNYPKLAVLDPMVVSSSPLSVLSSSGCDALVHSLESFVSPKSTFESRMFSKKAYELISKNLPLLLNGDGTLDNWLSMQWAAVFAMYSLSNSSSGPTGALSYYLGVNFKVNHGVAGAVFIGKVSQHNHDSGFYDYCDLYFGKEKELSKKEKSQYVVEEISQILKQAKIPKSLIELKVSKEDLYGFIEFSKNSREAFKMNPIEIKEKDLIDKILT